MREIIGYGAFSIFMFWAFVAICWGCWEILKAARSKELARDEQILCYGILGLVILLPIIFWGLSG